MDGHRFDDLAKALAVGASRRGVLKGLLGGAVGGAAAAVRSRGGSAAHKVVICHLTGSQTNPVVQIELSVNAIPAHEAHGDVIDPDFENDPANCGGCLISCDDDDPCTIDTCDEGVCVNTPVDCSALNDQCIVGVCVGGSCEAQPANEGAACNDGNACTEGETCQDGTCTGGGDINCNDGNACTVDTCEPATGCVHTTLDCNDGNACTTDRCDPATGCIHDAVNCDDGDRCTVDSCDPATGCVHEPVICGPNETCFGGECVGTCPATGTCAEGFPTCGGNDNCFCFGATTGVNLCIFSRLCSEVQTCTSDIECPAGEFCLTNDCCGGTCGIRCPEVTGGDVGDVPSGPSQSGG